MTHDVENRGVVVAPSCVCLQFYPITLLHKNANMRNIQTWMCLNQKDLRSTNVPQATTSIIQNLNARTRYACVTRKESHTRRADNFSIVVRPWKLLNSIIFLLLLLLQRTMAQLNPIYFMLVQGLSQKRRHHIRMLQKTILPTLEKNSDTNLSSTSSLPSINYEDSGSELNDISIGGANIYSPTEMDIKSSELFMANKLMIMMVHIWMEMQLISSYDNTTIRILTHNYLSFMACLTFQ